MGNILTFDQEKQMNFFFILIVAVSANALTSTNTTVFNNDLCSTAACFSLPVGCHSSMTELCTVVAIQSLPNGIGITIFNRSPSQSSGNWAGVGFSTTGTMNNADIYMCKSEKNQTALVSGFSLYQ